MTHDTVNLEMLFLCACACLFAEDLFHIQCIKCIYARDEVSCGKTKLASDRNTAHLPSSFLKMGKSSILGVLAKLVN